jgi:hypothetical protein
MNKSKKAGIWFLVAGSIVLILSAAADIIGIGENPYTFGILQIGGCILGAVLIIVGIILLLQRGHRITNGKSEA